MQRPLSPIFGLAMLLECPDTLVTPYRTSNNLYTPLQAHVTPIFTCHTYLLFAMPTHYMPHLFFALATCLDILAIFQQPSFNGQAHATLTSICHTHHLPVTSFFVRFNCQTGYNKPYTTPADLGSMVLRTQTLLASFSRAGTCTSVHSHLCSSSGLLLLHPAFALTSIIGIKSATNPLSCRTRGSGRQSKFKQACDVRSSRQAGDTPT